MQSMWGGGWGDLNGCKNETARLFTCYVPLNFSAVSDVSDMVHFYSKYSVWRRKF